MRLVGYCQLLNCTVEVTLLASGIHYSSVCRVCVWYRLYSKPCYTVYYHCTAVQRTRIHPTHLRSCERLDVVGIFKGRPRYDPRVLSPI
jgi:hypothetical protein